MDKEQMILILISIYLSLHAVQCSIQFETVNIGKIISMIRSGQSCVSIIQDFLNRISQFNGNTPSINHINAFITINSHELDQARTLDTNYSSTGNISGSLHCVRALIKDNFDVGMRIDTLSVI